MASDPFKYMSKIRLRIEPVQLRGFDQDAAATRSPPGPEPVKVQLRRPSAIGLMTLSAA